MGEWPGQSRQMDSGADHTARGKTGRAAFIFHVIAFSLLLGYRVNIGAKLHNISGNYFFKASSVFPYQLLPKIIITKVGHFHFYTWVPGTPVFPPVCRHQFGFSSCSYFQAFDLLYMVLNYLIRLANQFSFWILRFSSLKVNLILFIHLIFLMLYHA